MKTSPAGIKLICHFEGCKLEAYRCPAGIWTIGYGHTGAGVTMGLRINQARAEQLLAGDLAQFESIVSHSVTVPLAPNQFDALVSLVYNVGPGSPGHKDGIIWLANGTHSTLLRKLLASDYAGASLEFPRWCLPKNLPGILRRRIAEQTMFNGESTELV